MFKKIKDWLTSDFGISLLLLPLACIMCLALVNMFAMGVYCLTVGC